MGSDAGAGEGASGGAAADRLADIFARQADLAAFYGRVRPDGFYGRAPIERCATWTRAIVHECCELDDELGWKPWKNGRDPAETRAARLMEMADILHFFVQLALDQGFTAEELHAAYVRKNAENRERQHADPRYRPETPGGGADPPGAFAGVGETPPGRVRRVRTFVMRANYRRG